MLQADKQKTGDKQRCPRDREFESDSQQNLSCTVRGTGITTVALKIERMFVIPSIFALYTQTFMFGASYLLVIRSPSVFFSVYRWCG